MLRAVRILCALGRRPDARLVAREFAEHCRVDSAAADAIVALADRAALVEFAPGAEVMREGEPCDSISVILTGKCQVSRLGAGHLATLDRGHCFGEIGLLARLPRTATVTAVEPSTMMEMDRRLLADVSRTFPPLAAILHSVHRDRLLAQLVPPGSTLSALSPDQRHRLFTWFAPGSAPAGTVLLREGQEGHAFIVFVSGRAQVWRRAADGGREILGALGPGDFCGEISLLFGVQITVTVETTESSTWFQLDRQAFREFGAAVPAATESLAEIARLRLGVQAHGRDLKVGDWSGPLLGAVAESTGSITCPRCAFDQPVAIECVNCGTDMERERSRLDARATALHVVPG